MSLLSRLRNLIRVLIFFVLATVMVFLFLILVLPILTHILLVSAFLTFFMFHLLLNLFYQFINSVRITMSFLNFTLPIFLLRIRSPRSHFYMVRMRVVYTVSLPPLLHLHLQFYLLHPCLFLTGSLLTVGIIVLVIPMLEFFIKSSLLINSHALRRLPIFTPFVMLSNLENLVFFLCLV
ncbi:hypothetical protein CsSME_00006353 [Camellia sinensis var. sinensis]